MAGTSAPPSAPAECGEVGPGQGQGREGQGGEEGGVRGGKARKLRKAAKGVVVVVGGKEEVVRKAELVAALVEETLRLRLPQAHGAA